MDERAGQVVDGIEQPGDDDQIEPAERIGRFEVDPRGRRHFGASGFEVGGQCAGPFAKDQRASWRMPDEGKPLERVLDHVLGEEARGIGPRVSRARAFQSTVAALRAEDGRDRGSAHCQRPAVLASGVQAVRHSG